MTAPHEPLLRVSTREHAPLALDTWAGACEAELAAGTRLISLYGRPGTGGAAAIATERSRSDDEVITTAVFLTDSDGLRLIRGHGRVGQSYRALTTRFPATQMCERELWEQTGLIPLGHPWLKPVRYEGARQQAMHEYPFFSVRGQEIHEVGVGPIHASVIEPGHFRFMCHGEQVHHLEIQLGYQHRGVEALLLRRPPLALTPLVESIVGDSSVAYAWSYCAAVEALAGVTISPAADLVRGVALELERIAMHLVGLNGLATDIAFLQGGASYGRLRTAIINASMRVCGSRFGRGWLRPGGVRHGVDAALRQDLLTTLAAFARDTRQVNELMLGSRSVLSRLRGVGGVSHQAAADLGLLGLSARASGVAVDTRASLPGRIHDTRPIESLVEDSGDCYARLHLRMREIDASLRWLNELLQDNSMDLAAPPMIKLGALQPDSLCVSLREGFRGPVLLALETGNDGQLVHAKVQDPSLFNWFGLALAVRNNEISDFPICNKSFDLSYCGNDL